MWKSGFIITVLIVAAMGPVDAALKRSNHLFDGQLIKLIHTNESANIVYSPLSIQVALTPLYTAASGLTKTIITERFQLSEYDFQIFKTYLSRYVPPNFTDNYSSSYKPTVRLLTAILFNKGYVLSREFEQDMHGINTIKKQLDFSNSSYAIDEVNGLFSNVTSRKIAKLINSLDEKAKAALFNVIFFDCAWYNPFKTTFHASFYSMNGKQEKATFMNSKYFFQYKNFSQLSAQVVQFDFQFVEPKMIFLLPHENSSIQNLEKELHTTKLRSITDSLTLQYVNVTIPKFVIKSVIDLVKSFNKSDSKHIFGDESNDPYLLPPNSKFSISQAKHAAVIDVNERGIGEGPVSRYEFYDLSILGVYSYSQFLANRPFLFVIHDKDQTLLVGRVGSIDEE